MRKNIADVEVEFLNKKFNRLTVIKIYKNNKPGFMAECLCDCGVIKCVKIYHLLNKHSQSCGCLNRQLASSRRRIDLQGKKFGRLLVVKQHSINNYNIYWECLCYCGKISYPTTSNLTKKKNPTISCGCLLLEKGKNHFNWKDSIPEEDRILKRGVVKNPLYIEWIEKVYARDDYTCQLTNKKGIKLSAHHLYAWNSHADLRFDVNNGVTIDRNIHDKFHKIYGKGNNTKEQFEEFVRKFNYNVNWERGCYENRFE